MSKGLWNSKNNAHSSGFISIEVAIKKSGDDSSEEDRVLFLQEAVVMGQFNHPNIVRILAVFIHQELVTLMHYSFPQKGSKIIIFSFA